MKADVLMLNALRPERPAMYGAAEALQRDAMSYNGE